MKAILRGRAVWLAGLVVMPGTAFGQSAPAQTQSGTPATDAVGPQELQNFSLPGNVTRPADQPAATTPSTRAPASNDAPPAAERRSAPAPTTSPATVARGERPAVATRAPAVPAPTPLPAPATASPDPLATTQAPSFAPPATPAPQPAFPTATSSQPAAPLPAERKLLLWPWILAALALAAGTLFLLWRRRPREAFAGGDFDLFVPPEPAPAPPPRPAPAPPPRAAVPPVAPQPAPAPAPPRPSAPASTGIVSARLRPALEIAVQPLRCIVEDERVVLEFELELFNAGTAPARAVLAEASLFNAGANQDHELARFYGNPVGEGQRLDAIAPMKRANFVSQVVAPRDALQEYELGGRRVFVPLLGFNALYQWTGGEAQTSAAFLVGRETGAEKLGPLSLQRGPREIVRLGARPLPAGLRT